MIFNNYYQFLHHIYMVFKNMMLPLIMLQYLVLTLAYPYSLEIDKSALLAFKRSVLLDPNSVLSNWNQTNNVCNFKGIRCNKLHHRVEKFRLVNAQLLGPLPPFISNITRLKVLKLTGNHLFGNIPEEYSSLKHLTKLHLDDNNFHGLIPNSFTFLSKLVLIALTDNNLSGSIPPLLFSNCTSLQYVDLAGNFLTGNIPDEIGHCSNLWNLNLYRNQFTGVIPSTLANASLLYNLDVESNHLSGELPAKIVEALPYLDSLHLSYNNMISHNHNTNLDTFFTALTNCTYLTELELGGMGLGGTLPSSIGKLSVNLTYLLMQENRISGSIPHGFGNLSRLLKLSLSSNLLNGTIVEDVSQLHLLEQVYLSHNLFTGEIPDVIGRIPHLGLLDLSNNRFSGKIPDSFGKLGQLYYLFLNNNFLSGEIPPSLGQCKTLNKIDLSYNRLTGNIPQMSSLREIRIFLNFSHNHLEGPLPIELSKLENVQEIDLSANKLNGSIFFQISSCIALRVINLSNNSLHGPLPDSLGELKNLESFDVSQNNLSGNIPASLTKVNTLKFLDLSFNDFNGMIPSGGIFDSVTNLSFLGNPRLCGVRVSGIRICHKKPLSFHSSRFLILFVVVIIISLLFLTICCVLGVPRLKRMIPSGKSAIINDPSADQMIVNFPRISYKELVGATGGFNEQSLVGSGSYGRVYKGILPDGTLIAVKVLQLQTGNSTKTFSRECQVLKRIRHRNLMRIITACSLPEFKALVLPFMGNGSLDDHLYPNQELGLGSGSGSCDLDLIQRVNICSDIAQGMAYLHHHSPVRVIHCDLKPSNVLLNDDMTALVSDFGISRLVMAVGTENDAAFENMGNSTANMLFGSIGYIAPEYGYGSNTSTKGDVYSFGIVVLEMVTRKRPTDDMFVGGLSLHQWAKSRLNGEIVKIVDFSLIRAMRGESTEVKKTWEVAIKELIELGLVCTQESPYTRPTMLDAADDLDRLKRYLSGDTSATFASSLGLSSSIGDD